VAGLTANCYIRIPVLYFPFTTLWHYTNLSGYRAIIIIIIFLAHQHKAGRQLKIKIVVIIIIII